MSAYPESHLHEVDPLSLDESRASSCISDEPENFKTVIEKDKRNRNSDSDGLPQLKGLGNQAAFHGAQPINQSTSIEMS